jgi:hypothetical protein
MFHPLSLLCAFSLWEHCLDFIPLAHLWTHAWTSPLPYNFKHNFKFPLKLIHSHASLPHALYTLLSMTSSSYMTWAGTVLKKQHRKKDNGAPAEV